MHAFIGVRNKFPGLVNAVYLKIFLVLFCVIALFDTSVMVKKRYNESRDVFSEIGFVLRGFDQKTRQPQLFQKKRKNLLFILIIQETVVFI